MSGYFVQGLYYDQDTGVLSDSTGDVAAPWALSATKAAGASARALPIYGADKIRLGLAAIARSSIDRVNIVWHGHSVPAGQSSDDTTNTDLTAVTTWRTNGLAAHVARQLNAAFGGTPGLGVETMALYHRLFFTLASGAAISAQYGSLGVSGYSIAMNGSGHTCTFTALGTAVKVYGSASVAGVVARYNINGGSTTNATAAGSTLLNAFGTVVWYEFTITGLTAGDTVQLMGASSGTWNVGAVDLDYKTTAGVTVHRLTYSGNMGVQTIAACLDDTDTQPSANWNGAAGTLPAARRASQTAFCTTRMAADLAIYHFDVNDIKGFNFSGQAWGWTLADVKRHMTNYIANLAALGVPVLLIFGPIRDPASANTAGTPYTQQDIIDAYKACAVASTNAAYLDLTDEFTGTSLALRFAAQVATNLTQDTLHPNKAGHAYFGRRVAAALLAALGGS